MNPIDFKQLKKDIQEQAKNGIDFMLAASILWLGISYIWSLEFSTYNKSIFTFMIGALLLPMAFGFSKIFKTNWKVKNNPLQPLGLWLNFAQLIYFPILIFILITYPDYFIMTYAIITGAHLFPYAWFYDELGYLIVSIAISLGVLLIVFNIELTEMWVVPLYTSCILFGFTLWIYLKFNYLPKRK